MSGSRSSVRAQGDQKARIGLAYGIMAVALLLVGAYFGWNYMLSILLFCIVSAIMSLGVNIQWGYAGLFNAGIMGFTALGAHGRFGVIYAGDRGLGRSWCMALGIFCQHADQHYHRCCGLASDAEGQESPVGCWPRGFRRIFCVALVLFPSHASDRSG